jgi:hypothetical protein
MTMGCVCDLVLGKVYEDNLLLMMYEKALEYIGE